MQGHEVPRRSADQRREALVRANQVRSQRARLKTELKCGRISLGALITEPPPYLASARVSELLTALPGCGPIKTARLLERCGVNPRKSVAGLTERQLGALLEALKK